LVLESFGQYLKVKVEGAKDAGIIIGHGLVTVLAVHSLFLPAFATIETPVPILAHMFDVVAFAVDTFMK